MPIWMYGLPYWLLALLMVAGLVTTSLIGLFFIRRFLLPHLRFHDGVNDAVGGTVQSIGMFYGITVGLIAVSVWNTFSNTTDLISREAATIGTLYRDVSGYRESARSALQSKLRDYLEGIIEKDWPAHKNGKYAPESTRALNEFQTILQSYEPPSEGQKALHARTLEKFNALIEYRRLRIDAVGGRLSGVMWFVIWFGALIAIGVGFFFHIEDPKLHAILIGLMAAFLGIVVFLIMTNDRPFLGDTSIMPDSYQLILDGLIKPGG